MLFFAHSVTNSFFFLLLFLMTSLSILIEKGSYVLKVRWHLSAFAFKKLLENYLKAVFPTYYSFSIVTSTFSEQAYGVLPFV